ncbi:MAG: hypothetical protein ACXADB_13845, partial [Candidatus Hermodarchaeia archaeon]
EVQLDPLDLVLLAEAHYPARLLDVATEGGVPLIEPPVAIVDGVDLIEGAPASHPSHGERVAP